MGEITFNTEALYRALDAARRNHRITWRTLARQTGVNPSTVTRIAYGQTPGLESLARLLTWLGDTDIKPYITTKEHTR